MYDFNGKVVLVTGGAVGIGFSCVKEILRAGAQGVTIADINEANGKAAENELAKVFGSNKVLFLNVDVTKQDEFEDAFEKTLKKWKTIDILINNAGTFNDKQWEFQIDLNVTAMVRGNLLGLQYMGKDRGGKGGIIVNMASILGLQETHTLPIFSGTKHFTIGLTRSLGTPYHFDRTGVRIAAICPGYTSTPLADYIRQTDAPFLSPDLWQLYVKGDKDIPKQPAESVAAGVITCIKEGKNGSVWVVENKEHYEIVLPDRKTLRK
ncbi:hypothetical protein ILUMI_03277 [Ignelater luminosus]|uniref:15-hydroxyprostaglandin dehydrogenase [NAD(+)] n=1 Tax=Ignelater luminosus TaxID=2038154 RepID=A0A8K0GKL7_IGNLU|nr:hypothetical protein ILUMI_03277 [Ignelater luminosus]